MRPLIAGIRPVVWLGDSKDNLKEFPKKVRSDMGAALFAAQCGEMAEHVKPFKGVGNGVLEIVDRYKKDAYRLVYAVRIGDKIYVLHVFQKKSRKGIATPQQDIGLIKRRYKEAQETAKNEQ
jgi:phage-related protein